MQEADAWQLKDRSVIILLDNARAQRTAAALHGVAKSVRLVPGLFPDISTLIAEKGPAETAKLLVEQARAAPEWEPGEVFGGFGSKSENSFLEFSGFSVKRGGKNPSFPAEEFSRELRNISVCASESLQVAVDMPAVSALAAVSLCAQKKFKTHVQARHYEPTNLYTVIIARPSERKSPTISLIMGPIYRYQKEENDRRRPQVEEYRARRDMLQRRIESMKKTATSGKRAKNDSPATMQRPCRPGDR